MFLSDKGFPIFVASISVISCSARLQSSLIKTSNIFNHYSTLLRFTFVISLNSHPKILRIVFQKFATKKQKW